jgi:hypothetical protein
MDGEFVECPVGTFIVHYLPFEPTESDLSTFLAKATYTEPAAAQPSEKTPAPHVLPAIKSDVASAILHCKS